MDFEKEINLLKERNKRVETDKAWEGSFTRRVLIVVFTYISIGLYMKFVLNVENPFLNSVIPALGFTLSTLTLAYFKKLWVKYFYKK